MPKNKTHLIKGWDNLNGKPDEAYVTKYLELDFDPEYEGANFKQFQLRFAKGVGFDGLQGLKMGIAYLHTPLRKGDKPIFVAEYTDLRALIVDENLKFICDIEVTGEEETIVKKSTYREPPPERRSD